MKILLYTMVVFIVALGLYYNTVDKNPYEIDPVQIIQHWTVIEGNGNTFTTGSRYLAEKQYDDDFIIQSTLPTDLKDNMYLCFQTGKNVTVYIGGEKRAEFDEFRDIPIPGGCVKRYYMSVPLYASDAGAEVKLYREGTTMRGQIVPETLVGTQGAIYSFMMENFGFAFMMAEIIMIFSGVVIIVSLLMHYWYTRKIPMLYGAISIFIMAGWVVSNSLLYPFVFGHYHIDGVLNYLLCLLIPFGPTIYLNAIQKGRYKKIIAIVMVVSAINAVLWPILHFTQIFFFYEALPFIDVVLGLVAVAGASILTADLIRGYISEYKYTAIGFSGFIFFGVIEIFYIFLSTPKQEEIPMLFGLCFFLVFVVLQQVDDLRKVYVEKQHAINLSESKTRFLASMSHEIRTPINAILGMNEMILRENHDEVTLDYARSIKSSGKMLLMLVNDVLDFSKIEAGKLEITESRYDLSEVLYDVISLIGERSNEKGLTLKTEFTAPVPVGQISDEFRIRQILINLMNNAVKYTDSGSVTLKVGGKNTGDDGYELCFSVEDTGRGIRVEDQEELFEAFSRADMGKNVNIEGTGLGLAIVKSIVDSMHGNIEVESEYGKGSAFRVRIPVRVADPSPVPQDFMEKRKVDVVSEEECDFLAPDAKVLAVDDNRSNLTIVKLFLKRTGIVPDLCDNGKSALAKCREKKYDLILLDHMMPSPDGIETLQLIREDRDSKNKETAAVVLTANAVAGSRQIYMDAGFSDYLTKPLDFKVLEQTVKRYLPEDKVQSREEESKRSEDDGFFAEFLPHEESGVYGGTQGKGFEEKLSRIEGLDYRTAIGHSAGDEEVLAAVLADIAAEGAERCSRMRDNVSGRRWKEYGIDAHAVKGLMATIGMKDLSEKAKQQEFAAKEEDSEVILAGAEAFIGEYESLCRRLEELV